ncbi:NUDIX domain-containing protein [Promicromonospora sp. NPDC090134]|uniref:NUDIX domain-containing protein n=1 Tax=Promicromonospora sp. NPDC090134 TaxID=3364408 RepID=UPI0038139BF6
MSTATLFNTTTSDGPDATNPRDIDWAERQARAVVPFDVVNGLPVNPITNGLPEGRNGLWHWGEAVAADAVVLAFDINNRRRVLLVERADGHGWALPGGMLDPGETPSTATARELAEETGLVRYPGEFHMLPGRAVPDPRAGANAWMVTVPAVLTMHCLPLPEVQGLDDARYAGWYPADSYAELTSVLASGIFPAHVALLREVLDA